MKKYGSPNKINKVVDPKQLPPAKTSGKDDKAQRIVNELKKD